MKKIFYFSIVFMFINCNRSSFDFSDENEAGSEYPTKLHSFSEDDLQQLQSEFNALKGQAITAKLNNYGLVDYSGLLNRGKSNI
jgi:hypothetical protein